MFAPKRKRGILSRLGEAVMVGVVRAVFAFLRLLGPERSSALGGGIARTLGPILPVNRVAMNNLRAVYPDKDEAELKQIAKGAWENLGRVGAEYAHLGNLFDYEYGSNEVGRVEVEGIEHFMSLRDDDKPGLIFSAHLANWEMPAICAARYGLDATAVFRAPNDPAIARVLHEIRAGTMGGLEAARQGAAFAMQGALERGAHLGMLIDQHFTRGVKVSFMGRDCMVNPVMGKFARRFDCPVHGVRVIRLPGLRFKLQLTPPINLPRDENGEIDVAAAMQAMTNVIESWVREYPEQWLWMHRRWRPITAALHSDSAETQGNVTSA